jgi:hypothetical protein
MVEKNVPYFLVVIVLYFLLEVPEPVACLEGTMNV